MSQRCRLVSRRSFEYFVGAAQHCCWQIQSECLGGFQVEPIGTWSEVKQANRQVWRLITTVVGGQNRVFW
jgi:hypothetical protein